MSSNQVQIQSSKTASVKLRKNLRKRLENFPFLYKVLNKIYKIYYSFTGFLHTTPDFYILGAAKCGTSALYDYLIQHPSIHTAITKEPRYFDKYYDRGINWYKVLFPFKFSKFLTKKILKKEFVTGEATPRYLDHPHAPKRIKEITPNAKFIILLRNPVNRIYSHYNMRVNSGKETLSLQDAIKTENQRTEGEYKRMLEDENYYSLDYYHHSYLDLSIYVDKLKRWMDIFSNEQFLIIQSERFFSNPDQVFQEVLQFLNVPNFHLEEYSKVDAGKYEKSKMDSSVRKQLIEYFKPHNEELYKFLGINYGWDK